MRGSDFEVIIKVSNRMTVLIKSILGGPDLIRQSPLKESLEVRDGRSQRDLKQKTSLIGLLCFREGCMAGNAGSFWELEASVL